MKGITIIVILSIVWSIIAGIIEKKKAAAKKAASLPKQPTVQTELKADPINVKIESLRRRKKTQSVITKDPEPAQPRKHESVKSLHREDCPLPPQTSIRRATAPAKQLAAMLQNKRSIRTAIVLNEILSKPVSQRD